MIVRPFRFAFLRTYRQATADKYRGIRDDRLAFIFFILHNALAWREWWTERKINRLDKLEGRLSYWSLAKRETYLYERGAVRLSSHLVWFDEYQLQLQSQSPPTWACVGSDHTVSLLTLMVSERACRRMHPASFWSWKTCWACPRQRLWLWIYYAWNSSNGSKTKCLCLLLNHCS